MLKVEVVSNGRGNTFLGFRFMDTGGVVVMPFARACRTGGTNDGTAMPGLDVGTAGFCVFSSAFFASS